MEFFILVFFWFFVMNIVVDFVSAITEREPLVIKYTTEAAAARICVRIVFAVWACRLLWY